MTELDWGWDDKDRAAIAEWKRKQDSMTPEQELADNLRKYSTYGHAGAAMIERLASERDALKAENEKLRNTYPTGEAFEFIEGFRRGAEEVASAARAAGASSRVLDAMRGAAEWAKKFIDMHKAP